MKQLVVTYLVWVIPGLLPPGTQFDLFRGTAAMKQDEDDMYPSTLAHQIKVHLRETEVGLPFFLFFLL